MYTASEDNPKRNRHLMSNASGDRTPLLNGLLYGSASGLLGGSVWALFFSLPPEETLGAPRWILIGGAFLVWFFVGFLVGVFNAPQTARETTPPIRFGYSLAQRMLAALGWFFYRLIVGYFVGVIATILFALVGGALLFAGVRLFLDLKKILSESPLLAVGFSSMMTGIFCCFSGSIFGALMGTRRSGTHRPAIGPRSVRSSFVSFLFGVSFGAALRLPPDEEGYHILVYIALSVPIGILAGILGGLWTDVRRTRENKND